MYQIPLIPIASVALVVPCERLGANAPKPFSPKAKPPVPAHHPEARGGAKEPPLLLRSATRCGERSCGAHSPGHEALYRHGQEAEGMRFIINLVTPDDGEKFVVELRRNDE